MLIPDNIHPDKTIYYNGALVLRALQAHHTIDQLELYFAATTERYMSLPVFVLCLDWLYLLNLVTVDDQGQVQLCS